MPRQPLTPPRGGRYLSAVSSSSSKKSKNSQRALGHGQFPGAGECYAVRRTSSNPDVLEMCIDRIIQKLEESLQRGEGGIKPDSLYNAARVCDPNLARKDFEKIIEHRSFKKVDGLIFYVHARTPSAQRHSPYPSVRSPGTSRSPSKSNRLHHPTPVRVGPSSSLVPPVPTRLENLPKRQYDSRPSTPTRTLRPSTSTPGFLRPSTPMHSVLGGSPGISPSRRTASSIRSRLRTPLAQELIKYMEKTRQYSCPLQELIEYIGLLGLWSARDVTQAACSAPFMFEKGMVHYEPDDS